MRIVERKNFATSVGTFTGKGAEPEIRIFSYKLRQLLNGDENFLQMLAWIEKSDKLDVETVSAKKSEIGGAWDWKDMDDQLF